MIKLALKLSQLLVFGANFDFKFFPSFGRLSVCVDLNSLAFNCILWSSLWRMMPFFFYKQKSYMPVGWKKQ